MGDNLPFFDVLTVGLMMAGKKTTITPKDDRLFIRGLVGLLKLACLFQRRRRKSDPHRINE